MSDDLGAILEIPEQPMQAFLLGYQMGLEQRSRGMSMTSPARAGRPRSLRIGPPQSRWPRSELAQGGCPDCGSQCAPECGKHPAGCVFGGLDCYWLIADGCELDHGEGA
jgi:hypothetical protein